MEKITQRPGSQPDRVDPIGCISSPKIRDCSGEHDINPGAEKGCCSNSECISAPSKAHAVLDQLKASVASIDKFEMKHQVEAFYSCLESSLMSSEIGIPLPEFYIITEDDEFYLEWIFDRCRFGFDFFSDEKESAWFALIQQDNGMLRSSSTFDDDYREAVDYALAVITRES